MNDTMETVQTREPKQIAEGVNVGTAERVASGVLGAAIAGYGLSRKSLFGAALALLGGQMIYRGVAGHCHLYQALDVDTSGRRDDETLESRLSRRGADVNIGMTINRSARELYDYWRNFENLPRFMKNLESVSVADRLHSHWVLAGPGDRKIEWDARIVEDQPDALIGWHSLPGADVDSAGAVSFTPAPGGRGTEVRVVMRYDVPGGKIGATVARLLGHDPAVEVREDLRSFKRIMEAGQLPRTEGQPHAQQPQDAMLQRRKHFGFGTRDIVDQASWESFPASDSPAY